MEDGIQTTHSGVTPASSPQSDDLAGCDAPRNYRGKPVTFDYSIRVATLDDAQKLLSLRKELHSETEFMLYTRAEIGKVTLDDQTRLLGTYLSRPNSRMFLAESAGQLIGFLSVDGGGLERVRHSGYVIIGILEPYRGCGVGRSLFEAMHEWAPTVGISRLHLSVMTTNSRAVQLYQRHGYEVEGIKRQSSNVNGVYYDDYLMAKLLTPRGEGY